MTPATGWTLHFTMPSPAQLQLDQISIHATWAGSIGTQFIVDDLNACP